MGEQPEAAFGGGANVNHIRYLHAGVGGALVGFAGATYSFSGALGTTFERA